MKSVRPTNSLWILISAISCSLAIWSFLVPVPSTPGGHLTLGIAITLSFIGIAVAYWKRSLGRTPESNRAKFSIAIAVVATALLVAACILRLGMTQFGGFDHSALIDLGWRLYQGQTPTVDFPCPMPPIFYWGAWLAYCAFDPTWWSLVAVTAAFAAVTFVWLFFLLSVVLENALEAWLFALAVQLCTNVLASYWWYNPVTSVMGCIYLASCSALISCPRSRCVQVSFVSSLLLLCLCKPNVAGPLVLGASVVGLISTARVKFAMLSVLAAVGAALVLMLLGVTPLALWNEYIGVAARGSTLNQLFQDLSDGQKLLFTGLLFACLVPWLTIVQIGPKALADARLQLAAVGVISGLCGFLTNGEAKLVDMPLIFLGTALFLVRAASLDKENSPDLAAPLTAQRYLVALTILLMGVATAQAVVRSRVEAIGPGVFFEHELVAGHPSPEFFAGLKTGRNFQAVCTEVETALRQTKDSSVYFGPRMQWAYAAFGIEPPRHQPSWWHPGVAFSQAEEGAYIAQWDTNRFGTLMFLKGDATYMSPEFISLIQSHYRLLNDGSNITVLQRLPGL